jgi:hypothetical protein
MKWKSPFTIRREKRLRQTVEYTEWYAWYPVRCENGVWVWLEKVKFIRNYVHHLCGYTLMCNYRTLE